MNGCMSKNSMRQPDTSPMTEPISTMISTTRYGFHPAWASIIPATLLNAITAPTDRSIPPVRITKVMPTARITRCELLISRFEIVLGCRMAP